MQEDVKGDDVAPVNNSDAVKQEIKTTTGDAGREQSVKFETYDKVMRRLKAKEQELETAREETVLFQQEKLEAEGKKDELITSLRTELTESKRKSKEIVGTVATSNALSIITDVAVKSGCAPESLPLLRKFVQDDIGSLEFDANFKPDHEQVVAMIEDVRQKAPVLFSKAAPKMPSHNVNTSTQNGSGKQDVKKMKMDQLMKVWAEEN